MRISQSVWKATPGWASPLNLAAIAADLVLVFGSRNALSDGERYADIREAFPGAHIVCSSTAGEIYGSEVLDDSVTVTAIEFEQSQIRTAMVEIEAVDGLHEAGKTLAKELLGDDLALVFVLADGQNVNGSALVEGLNVALKGKVPVTGGLAGDGTTFERTLVGLNEAPKSGVIVAIGFYGRRLLVGHGSMGGWDTFGPMREVTRSQENILFELDGESALNLYKDYLGELAAELPGSALLFPLSMQVEGRDEELVRTVLNVDEARQSMTFAGNIPVGAKVQLMRANFDRIIDGAGTAAARSLAVFLGFKPELALLISCVGRKLILGQRVEEEVENVRDTIGESAYVTGFYSYGEISPPQSETGCSLHNQTMTITTLAEQ